MSVPFAKTSLVALLSCVVCSVSGCGRSEMTELETGAGVETEILKPLDSPADSKAESSDTGGEPVMMPLSPPGEMKLPEEVLKGLPTPTVDSAGPTKPGAGGFEMPAADGSQANAVDEPVDDSNVSKTARMSGRLNYAHWSAIETELKSDGKITVVDFWSTSCEPCLRELPGLVRLQRNFGDSVRCVAVNVDFDGRARRPPEFYFERTQAFLSSINASFDPYICRTPSEDVYAAIGIVSIPAVLIYDESGKLVKQFVDAGATLGFSYDEDVLPFIETMVKPREIDQES